MDKKNAHKQRTSAIERLVKHFDGPVALARKLAPDFPYQRIQEWVSRGWASPHYFNLLEPILPSDLTIAEFYQDREIAKKAA